MTDIIFKLNLYCTTSIIMKKFKKIDNELFKDDMLKKNMTMVVGGIKLAYTWVDTDTHQVGQQGSDSDRNTD